MANVGYETTVDFMKIRLETDGFSDLVTFLKRIATEMRMTGKSADEVDKKLQSVKKDLLGITNRSGSSPFSSDQIDSALKRVAMANLSGRNSALESFGKIQVAMMKLRAAFAAPIKLKRFADQLANVNMELRKMAFNANMSVSSLGTAGGVLAAFGGSEKDVASSSNRYTIQMERARQGQGFGYLQDNSWKYGMSFNMGESWESRFKRIIDRMSSMSKGTRLAFAADEGLSDSQRAIAFKYADSGGSKAYEARANKLAKYNDGMEEAGEASVKYKEQMAELSAAMTQLKSKVFTVLEKALSPIIKAVTVVVHALSKGLWPTVLAVLAAITTVIATISGLVVATNIASTALKRLALSALPGKGLLGGLGGAKIPGGFTKVGGLFLMPIRLIGQSLSRILAFFPTISRFLPVVARLLGPIGAGIGVFAAGFKLGNKIFEVLSRKSDRELMKDNARAIREGDAVRKKAIADKIKDSISTGHVFSERTKAALMRQGKDVNAIERTALLNYRAAMSSVDGVGMVSAMNAAKSVDKSLTINMKTEVQGYENPREAGEKVGEGAAAALTRYSKGQATGVII